MRLATALTALLLLTTAVQAQNVCPCIPKGELWTAKTADSFNTAISTVAGANGSPLTFMVPINVEDQRWLVLQRIPSGAYIDDGNDPFKIEAFDAILPAMLNMMSIERDRNPMIVTSPDGTLLVLSLKQLPPKKQRVTNR